MNTIRAPRYPTHAALVKDNWDGEGDKYVVLAFIHDSHLHSFESLKPLIQYGGDEIIKSWVLCLSEKEAQDQNTTFNDKGEG